MVAIVQEKPRRLVPGECLANLLRGLSCGRMCRHSNVDEASAIVHQQDQHEYEAAGRRRDDKEIRRHQVT